MNTPSANTLSDQQRVASSSLLLHTYKEVRRDELAPSSMKTQKHTVYIGGVPYEVELALTASAEQSSQPQNQAEEDQPIQQNNLEQQQHQPQPPAAVADGEEDDEWEPQNLVYSLFRLGFLFALLAQNGSPLRVAILSVLSFLIVLNQLGVYRWDTVTDWIYRRRQHEAPQQPLLLNDQQQEGHQQQPQETGAKATDGFWMTLTDICLSFLTSAFPAPPQQHGAAPPVAAGAPR